MQHHGATRRTQLCHPWLSLRNKFHPIARCAILVVVVVEVVAVVVIVVVIVGITLFLFFQTRFISEATVRPTGDMFTNY